MNRTEVSEILGSRGLSPLRKLGQNFLVRQDIIDRIVALVSPGSDDAVLEIGPGLGALTGPLLERAGSYTAVELDGGLADYLDEVYGNREGFTLVRGDFLRATLPGPYTMAVSNLPYYCASEMLFRMALVYAIPRMFVMVQKEMADRLVARPGSPAYGALTVSLGFYYTGTVAFTIPRDAFFPAPEVTSSFMSFIRRDSLPLPADRINAFHLVVRSAFWGRRKKLGRALTDTPHLSLTRDQALGMCSRAGLSPDRRGEELSLEDFCLLASELPVGAIPEER